MKRNVIGMVHKTLKSRTQDRCPLAKDKEPLVDRLDPKRLLKIRRLAKTGLISISSKILKYPDSSKYLIALLKDSNAVVKRTAAWTLLGATRSGITSSIAITAVSKALKDKDITVRSLALGIFEAAAEKGIDISIAIPAIVEVFKDMDQDLKKRTIKVLGLSLENGTGHSIILTAIIDTLNDNDHAVRDKAVKILKKAVVSEKTRNDAITRLIPVLKHYDLDVRHRASWVLICAADNDKYEIVKLIVAGLAAFMQSKEFMIEAENNTPIYTEMIGYVNKIIAAAQKSETKWVGATT